ncbi:hypothetical protein LTR37_004067 [Vermiconidia calcicola]|uniref:Uncharacterized protein n=1 Tax=Vermiconidia calcicola TaxID=1690605 RepID=A0ACC3NN41_9PEZI|nr:hypothetical protein LTR37_004067 [Vermiconidia calcicola]
MALPAELRNWIYELVLEDSGCYAAWPPPGMLSVSRQIRREASSMFWAAKPFAFQVEEEDELINALEFFDESRAQELVVYFYYPDEEPCTRIEIDTSKVWESDVCPYYEKVIEDDDFGDGEPNDEARWKQTEYLNDTFSNSSDLRVTEA